MTKQILFRIWVIGIYLRFRTRNLILLLTLCSMHHASYHIEEYENETPDDDHGKDSFCPRRKKKSFPW